MQDPREPVYTAEEAKEHIAFVASQQSIDETKRESVIANAGMVAVMSLAIAVWFFFA